MNNKIIPYMITPVKLLWGKKALTIQNIIKWVCYKKKTTRQCRNSYE